MNPTFPSEGRLAPEKTLAANRQVAAGAIRIVVIRADDSIYLFIRKYADF
jgi:hypothetical protein